MLSDLMQKIWSVVRGIISTQRPRDSGTTGGSSGSFLTAFVGVWAQSIGGGVTARKVTRQTGSGAIIGHQKRAKPSRDSATEVDGLGLENEVSVQSREAAEVKRREVHNRCHKLVDRVQLQLCETKCISERRKDMIAMQCLIHCR